MKSQTRVYFYCTTLLLALGLPAAAFAQFRFEDVSSKIGIDASSSQPTEIGPGPVIFDFDNDGWEDVYCPGGASHDHLFRNLGNGTFVDVADSNIQNKFYTNGYSRGGSAFDFDNDGLTDLYICCERHDILLKNMGGGVFADWTKRARIATPVTTNESNCSTFGDFDGDGDNDLYVARWIQENRYIQDAGNGATAYAHKGYSNQLYVNNGNGSFTESAFPYHVDGDTGCSNIALFFDIDGDGDLDLLVGNDFGVELYPNIVFKNMLMETGKATFVDVTDSIGLRTHLFCMGITPCDYNRDGKFDFYETNVGDEVLMKNNGGLFQNAAVEANIPNGRVRHNQDFRTVTWSVIMNDFDNDGWEDGFIVHGYEQAIPPWITTDPDTSEYIRNLGGVFEDYTDTAMNGQLFDLRARGGAAFDYDHDGFYDIVFGSTSLVAGFATKDFRIFHNITHTINNNPAHMLEMKFHAKRTAKEAIGTIVNVWVGGTVLARQVCTGGGFASMTSLVQHVGLGGYTAADSIVVYWPCDSSRHRQIDRYYNIGADQMLTFEEKMDSTSIGLVATEPLHVPFSSVPKPSAPLAAIGLYPQPAQNILNIENIPESSPVSYEVYNILGERVASGTAPTSSLRLALGSFPAGSYTLRLVSSTSSITKRFIKQ